MNNSEFFSMKVRKEFVLPFLILLFALAFDKLFLLGNLPLYYLTTLSFLNFRHKENLIEELHEYLLQPAEKRKKVLVILGNSRTLAFDNDYIQRKYPDWILFNFSVPGGKQDYFLYIVEKFLEKNIHPDAIVLSVTPQAMNQSAGVLVDEVMVFGLPPDFLIRYLPYFRVPEITNYLGKKLFITYRYKPRLGTIQKRREEKNLLQFVSLVINTEDMLNTYKGSVPYRDQEKILLREEEIRYNAESMWRDFYMPFVLDKNALFFLEKAIAKIKSMNIEKVYLLWPPVSHYLREKKKKENVAIFRENGIEKKTTIFSVWQPQMVHLADTYRITWIDMNYTHPLNCDYFFDASHISSFCYPYYTDHLFSFLRRY